MADALHYVKQKDWKANALQNMDMTTLIMYFLGRKLRSTHLRQDDSEAADGARGLWPSAEEECDRKHSEEPREDPRLGEERGDVVSLNEEKTTHIKWTSNGTDKSRENLIILKKTSMRVFYVNMYWCYSQSQNGQWMECWSQFTDLKICF